MLSAGIHSVTDTNSDGRISPEEFDKQLENAQIREGDYIRIGDQRYEVRGNLQDFLSNLRSIIAADFAANESPSGAQLNQAKTDVEDAYRVLQQEQQELEIMEAGGKTPAEIAQQKQMIEAAKQRLAQQLRLLQQLNINKGKGKNDGINADILRAAGMTEGEGGAKAMMTSGSQPGAGAGSGMKATTTGGTPTGFMPPSGWGAQTAAMPTLSTDAYMQSMMMEDSVLSSFDSVLKNQGKGRNLMMLFFYFARMAESGDLGAMYQFMKFLTYIISKDKSKQQIDMGKKLIELQDLSRQWTDKLLGMSTNSTDPNASAEFTKVMTQVKSETDAIATSQKLIASMMEEFAQIVETLTNSTKGALEANGRVLRTMSRMQG